MMDNAKFNAHLHISLIIKVYAKNALLDVLNVLEKMLVLNVLKNTITMKENAFTVALKELMEIVTLRFVLTVTKNAKPVMEKELINAIDALKDITC